MLTGKFLPIHNAYFSSNAGAYTSMTAREVNKGTYNVKAVIRNMVVNKLTEAMVKGFNSSDNIALFNGCSRIPELRGKKLQLVFKYAKSTSKEMSIYFSAGKGIPNNKILAGSIWYIYFKGNDQNPFFGVMTESEWAAISRTPPSGTSAEYALEELEFEDSTDVLEFYFHVDSVVIEKTSRPSRITVQPDKNPNKSTPISKEKLEQRLQNKKIRGDKGEEIVVHIEKKKLLDAGRKDLAEKVEWVSFKEDGHGYDIKSFEILADGSAKEIVIEVKATSRDNTTPFYISLNELNASKEYGDSYYLYRIFNLDKAGANIKYYVIQGNLEVSLNLMPVSFRAI